MTTEKINERLQEIEAIKGDDEMAHSKEDKLHQAFISYVAELKDSLPELAAKAELEASPSELAAKAELLNWSWRRGKSSLLDGAHNTGDHKTMIMTKHVKRVLRFQREAKRLEAQGYRRHETDWEIIRGGRQDERIVDAKVSVCGRYVYTKLEKIHSTNKEEK